MSEAAGPQEGQEAAGESQRKPQPDEVSDIKTIWGLHNNSDVEVQKGLEYFASPNSNRIMIIHTGCCSHLGRRRFIIKDRSMQKIYNVRGGGCCQQSVLATVQDFRKKEILRFKKDRYDKLSVLYRKDTKIGEIIAYKKEEALADSYLLYIVNDADGEELLRIFSNFDGTECMKSETITCFVLGKKAPFEAGSFEHTSKGFFTHCCSHMSNYSRETDFRCDFTQDQDPFTKCLILAAAFWRMTEGFRRYKD